MADSNCNGKNCNSSGKKPTDSKTIKANLVLGVVSVLIALGYLPDTIEVSPDAGWVGVVTAILNCILRFVTTQPIVTDSIDRIKELFSE